MFCLDSNKRSAIQSEFNRKVACYFLENQFLREDAGINLARKRSLHCTNQHKDAVRQDAAVADVDVVHLVVRIIRKKGERKAKVGRG